MKFPRLTTGQGISSVIYIWHLHVSIVFVRHIYASHIKMTKGRFYMQSKHNLLKYLDKIIYSRRDPVMYLCIYFLVWQFINWLEGFDGTFHLRPTIVGLVDACLHSTKGTST